uniref:MADF domain-containing protein n=2 Tax=Heliothis virescens TaxID=7102 RepID=A0A2A4JD89_HELVI
MEEFIDMIRQLPCLWDTGCKDYRDMRKKDTAWKRIVAELKCKDIPDIKTAKAEWKKLRDSHRDSLKRARASASGQNTVISNKWKYADIMEFLLPYMRTRKRRRCVTTSSDEDKESSSSPVNTFLEIQPSTSNTLNLTPESQIDKMETSLPNDHVFKKRKIDNEIGEIMIDMDRNNSQYGERNKHPLDSFFESMCETTKQFPTWLQYTVKRKIFNVISEAEDTFETYKSRESIF